MKRIPLLIVAVAMLCLVSVPTVLAHEAENGHNSSDDNVAVETETETETEHGVTTTTVTTSTREERIAKFKADLKTKLTTAEQTRIKNHCQAAQGKVSKLSGRITGIETSRKKIHSTLVERLNKLVTKLDAADVDTTELKAEITELSSKITTFNADLASYKQAVDDLEALDCTTDPTAFKAALESARTLRETVAKDAAAIRSYVKETIKPTLAEIKTQLAAQTSDSSEDN